MARGRVDVDYPGEAHCVVERSWGLRWTRSGIALWHRRELFGTGRVFGQDGGELAPGARRGWIAAGVVAIGSIGLTTAGVVARPVAERWAAGPLVSVAVPSATPLKTDARAATPKRRLAVVKPIASRPAEAASSKVVAPIPPATALTGEDAAADVPAAREADAVAAALSSGKLQSWAEPEVGVQGFVVVGDADTNGGQTCRDISVLRKSDAGSKVERYRRCVSGTAGG